MKKLAIDTWIIAFFSLGGIVIVIATAVWFSNQAEQLFTNPRAPISLGIYGVAFAIIALGLADDAFRRLLRIQSGEVNQKVAMLYGYASLIRSSQAFDAFGWTYLEQRILSDILTLKTMHNPSQKLTVAIEPARDALLYETYQMGYDQTAIRSALDAILMEKGKKKGSEPLPDLSLTKPENVPAIRDAAMQRATAWTGALVAEVFGMFVIYSLVTPIEPWPPTDLTLARDGLLGIGSAFVALMIGVAFVRAYHQNQIVVKARELIANMKVDQQRFDDVGDSLTRGKFSIFASFSIKLTHEPRLFFVFGGLVFALLWAAVLL
jgi:hypothetical protein